MYSFKKILFFCFLTALSISIIVCAPIKGSTQQIISKAFPPEKQYQKQHLVVGSELDYPPYALVNSQGKADGFSVDLIKAVAEVMDLELEFKVKPWNEIRTNLEKGEIDVLPLVSYNPERARVFDFSAPHTIAYAAAFARKGSPRINSIDDLRDQKIIVMKSDWTHDYLHRKNISPNLILVKDLADALRLLASGKYDYVFAPMLPGLLLVKQLHLSNIGVAGKPIQVENNDFSFAVKKGNTKLLFILNQGLQIIKTNGKYDQIYDKWFGEVAPRGMDQEEVIKLIRNIGIASAVLAFGILAWSFSLKRKVYFRTLELEKQIAQRIKVEMELRQTLQIKDELAKTATAQATQIEQAMKELRQTQSQLIHTEKMLSLGQLVGGLAHEINNPISFIYGNLSHLRNYHQNLVRLIQSYQQYYPDPPEWLQKDLEEIELDFVIEDGNKILKSMELGSERIRDIVLSLRNFSRLNEAEVKQVDIHKGIDSTLVILQNSLRIKPNYPEIKVIKNYGQIPPVECYPGQLNQVYLNLLTNAIYALEEKFKQEELTIKNQNNLDGKLDNYHIWINTELVNNNLVKINIADNGCGISEEVHKHIFDPFFTTKPVGKGTGLGLSISYQIVTVKHGGKLWCNSTPGKGTQFVIEIPMHL
ncbi:transporter substrate-binding domain-containing protein [Anabaena sp. PCC 7108]|uniref:transporter substrate-binding domain-containing protein n=1 Tax=Anabaena sp. PCC 7108 TaxID=163908 RepID=UPI00034D148F|nr:transporter substrate-binding domain-containing protein [Anabaena sp. PCC 7108]